MRPLHAHFPSSLHSLSNEGKAFYGDFCIALSIFIFNHLWHECLLLYLMHAKKTQEKGGTKYLLLIHLVSFDGYFMVILLILMSFYLESPFLFNFFYICFYT